MLQWLKQPATLVFGTLGVLLFVGEYHLRHREPAPAKRTLAPKEVLGNFAVTGSLRDEYGKIFHPTRLVLHKVEEGEQFDPNRYEAVESGAREKTSLLVFEFANAVQRRLLWIPVAKSQTDWQHLTAKELLMENNWTESPDWEVEHWVELKRVSFSLAKTPQPNGQIKLDLNYRSYRVDDHARNGVLVRSTLLKCDSSARNCEPIKDVVAKGTLTLNPL